MVSSIGNYPNPFDGSTTLVYSLDDVANIKLEVVDVLGKVVAVLADGLRGPGEHRVNWEASDDGSKRPAGMYFLRLSAEDLNRPADVGTVVRSMILAR